MKQRIQNNFRWLFLIMISGLFMMYSISCIEKGQNKHGKKRIIPEKTLTAILTDLHMTDGLLTIASIRDKFPGKDSVAAYTDVIRHHGYTKEDLDTTLSYYYTRKPKRLIRIYDRILAKFSEMDSKLTNIQTGEILQENNLWPGLPVYYLPADSAAGNTGFSIPVNGSGYYIISFTVTVYPFDQTADPEFLASFCSADSTETGKKYYSIAVKYIKDGLPHSFTFTGKNDKNYPQILKGDLYSVRSNQTFGEKYGKIEKIRVSFTPG